MTFAEQVVVMHEGTVVQVGTPVELFERPRHTFVGHFIGSPGMNILPCEVDDGVARFAGLPVPTANAGRRRRGRRAHRDRRAAGVRALRRAAASRCAWCA